MKKILSSLCCAAFACYAGGCLTLSRPDGNGSNATPSMECAVSVDTSKIVKEGSRAKLMGLNIAAYHGYDDCAKAFDGYLRDIDMGLVRIPGGSLSDKFYWNGNGVIKDDGTIDESKFKPFKKQGYWEIDYSGYKPGFCVDAKNWRKIYPVSFGAKRMMDITKKHPVATNLITVNVGTGTPEMAAEWVKWANIKHHYNVKYWELGNELNGIWEPGHFQADGSEMTVKDYIVKFKAFYKAMKAVDPSIMIGGPACDVDNSDFFEPFIKEAGGMVDFLSFHFYSLRSSLAPEEELFDGLTSLKPVIAKLDALVEKYHPERLGGIPYSITEWNSKLPKDQDAYRLFNGLWFSAWVGEMLKAGVDSSTVWDIFSGRDNGHGLLVRHGKSYVPTGRYWAFWLWSHYMADTLVESKVSEPGREDLHVYATSGEGKVDVLVMNESRTETYSVKLNIAGFKPTGTGREVTLSSKEYFWNPYAFEANPNKRPSVRERALRNGARVTVPPYCVKIFQFDETADLRVLLPKSEFCDLAVEGWVRAFKSDGSPLAKNLGAVKFKIDGPARIKEDKVVLANSAAKFTLLPTGKAGKVVVTAECDGSSSSRSIQFKPVALTDYMAWNFDDGKIKEPVRGTEYGYEIAPTPDGTGKALEFTIPQDAKDGHLIDIIQYPKGVPRERIGGMVFDLVLPKDLKVTLGNGVQPSIQAVMQSTGAYWIPCGSVPIDPTKGERQTFRLEIPDKKFLKVMDRAFSVVFVLINARNVNGPIMIDNVGFLIRPPKK